MKEIWKPVKNFESKYKISNFGRLYSLISKKIIKPTKCTNGYLEYQLANNGKRIIKLVHRLVAETFIDNPNKLPQINHKNEIITDNRVENLEWCSAKYNANYGLRNYKCREKNKKYFKAVAQFTKEGKLVGVYECIESAARAVNGDSSYINRVCKGINKSAYNYKWQFIK